MRARAVEVLIEEAKFAPQTAVAVAKAVDMVIEGADLLTVTKFSQLMAERDVRLEKRWAEQDLKFEKRWGELDAKLERLEGRISVGLQEVRTEQQGIKAELMRWVFLTMLGNVALSMAARLIIG